MKQQSCLTRAFKWIGMVMLISLISVGFRFGTRALFNSVSPPEPTSTPADPNIFTPPAILTSTPAPSEFEVAMAKLPAFQAIRKADPDKYQELVDQVNALVSNGGTQAEISNAVRDFVRDYTDSKLKHASQETILAYLRLRVKFYREATEISPEYTYSMIKQIPYDIKADKNYKKLGQVVTQFSYDMVTAVASAPAGQPIPYDEARAKKNFTRGLQKVPLNLLRAFQKARKGSLTSEGDKKRYCQGFAQLYDNTLELPPQQAVEVFRYIGDIPADDRN